MARNKRDGGHPPEDKTLPAFQVLGRRGAAMRRVYTRPISAAKTDRIGARDRRVRVTRRCLRAQSSWAGRGDCSTAPCPPGWSGRQRHGKRAGIAVSGNRDETITRLAPGRANRFPRDRAWPSLIYQVTTGASPSGALDMVRGHHALGDDLGRCSCASPRLSRKARNDRASNSNPDGPLPRRLGHCGSTSFHGADARLLSRCPVMAGPP